MLFLPASDQPGVGDHVGSADYSLVDSVDDPDTAVEHGRISIVPYTSMQVFLPIA